MASVIKKIDKSLANYYKRLGKDYDKLFENYCEENGFDEEFIQEECDLDDPSDSMLIDFDEEHFPFKIPPKNEQEKKQFIFNLIRKCYEDELPSILKDADYEKLLDDFEKCVADGCRNVPKILYSMFSFSGYNLPKSHDERGKQIREKLEKIALDALENKKPIHPFYIFYLVERRFYSRAPFDPFCGKKDKYINDVLEIFRKGQEMTKNEAKYVEMCLAGNIFDEYNKTVGQFDNYKQWKSWYEKRKNLYQKYGDDYDDDPDDNDDDPDDEYYDDDYIHEQFYYTDSDGKKQYFEFDEDGNKIDIDFFEFFREKNTKYSEKEFNKIKSLNKPFHELLMITKREKKKLSTPLQQYFNNIIKHRELSQIQNENKNNKNDKGQKVYISQHNMTNLPMIENDSKQKEWKQLKQQLNKFDIADRDIFKLAYIKGQKQIIGKQEKILQRIRYIDIYSNYVNAVGIKLQSVFQSKLETLLVEFESEEKSGNNIVRIAPVKTASRMVAKSKRYEKYGHPSSQYMLDILRATITMDNPDQIVKFYKYLRRKLGDDVVYVKNDFNAIDKHIDWRKLMLNIIVRHPQIKTLEMISELQLTTKRYLAERKLMHIYYNVERCNGNTYNMAKDFAKLYSVNVIVYVS